jgi:hypothetical protein
MIHQKSLGEQRKLLNSGIKNAISGSDFTFPVQLCWYQNRQDGKYHPQAEPMSYRTIDTFDRLSGEFYTRDAGTLLPTVSLTHGIHQLWNLYYSYRYERLFSGTIHIFSAERFCKENFRSIKIGTEIYTFRDFTESLSELADGPLQIYLHSPYEPENIQELALFQWVPMLEKKLTSSASLGMPPIYRTDIEPLADQQQKLQMTASVEKQYLLGAEGLFFADEDGKKIYVSRRKNRGR